MNQRVGRALLGTVLLLLPACAQKVRVPPRVDLASVGTIGVIEFSSDSERDLHGWATERFLGVAQSSQSVSFLELGSEQQVLRSIGRPELDLEAVRAIGEKYRVKALLTGYLHLTEARPKVQLSTALESLSLRAQIDGSLRVKLRETATGATRWTNTARGSRSLARADVVARGGPSLAVDDPERAYAALVAWLVDRVSADLRPSYVRP